MPIPNEKLWLRACRKLMMAVRNQPHELRTAVPSPMVSGDSTLLLRGSEHLDLEALGHREADFLARRNLHRLTRLRVAPHARLALHLSERTEIRNLDGVAFLDRADDGCDQPLHQCL